VHSEERVFANVDPILPHDPSDKEDPNLFYPSNSYQKILDYHVVEILLTTVVFGVAILLRLHH
jgi:hypothetical protein